MAKPKTGDLFTPAPARKAAALCQDCAYWQQSQPRYLTDGAGNPRSIGNTVGECHRSNPHVSYVWPKTNGDDWCGEWRDQAARVKGGAKA